MDALPYSRFLEVGRSLVDAPAPLTDLARRCYPDMAVAVSEAEDVWRIRLSPLAPMAAARDGELRSVLADMKIGPGEMTRWRRTDRIGGIVWLEALSSAWALFAWSQWLSAHAFGRPLILLLGGGDALGIPQLICGPELGAFVGLMEDFTFRVDDPSTVAAAIECGVIGGGSFVTPFLRTRAADIVQLPSVETHGDRLPVRFTVGAGDSVGEPPIRLLASRAEADGGCSYRQVGDPIEAVIGHDAERPVLIYIDLGAFDQVPSRRRTDGSGPAMTPAETVERLAPLANSIAAVSLAYSPAFCPSRSWRPLADELRGGFQRLFAHRNLGE